MSGDRTPTFALFLVVAILLLEGLGRCTLPPTYSEYGEGPMIVIETPVLRARPTALSSDPLDIVEDRGRFADGWAARASSVTRVSARNTDAGQILGVGRSCRGGPKLRHRTLS
jgi:hypothetical protein